MATHPASHNETVTAHEGGKSAHSTFPPFDSANFQAEFAWLLVSFVVLYVVLSKVTLPILRRFIEERRTIIKTNLDIAETLNRDNEAELALQHEALQKAKAQAEKILLEAKQSASLLFDENKTAHDKKNADNLNTQIAKLDAEKQTLLGATADIHTALSSLIIQKIAA